MAPSGSERGWFTDARGCFSFGARLLIPPDDPLLVRSRGDRCGLAVAEVLAEALCRRSKVARMSMLVPYARAAQTVRRAQSRVCGVLQSPGADSRDPISSSFSLSGFSCGSATEKGER